MSIRLLVVICAIFVLGVVLVSLITGADIDSCEMYRHTASSDVPARCLSYWESK